MRKVILILLAVLVYFLTWPVAIEPQAWFPPEAPDYRGEFAQNSALAAAQLIPLNGIEGPEDIAANSRGELFFSAHDGGIYRYHNDGRIEAFVNTGGRPLGLSFGAEDNLLIADAYLGLVRVTPSGIITVLTTQAAGIPIRYADDVDVAADGMIYFTDASTKFGAKENGGTLPASLLDIMEHGGHGRILRYDPSTGLTEEVLSGLQFANGIEVSHDSDYLLFIETGKYRVLKYWLTGPRQGYIEIIADNLPGFPDNINKSSDGHYWVGLVSPRNAMLDALGPYPRVRMMVQRLPSILRPKAEDYGHLLKISGEGEVLLSLQEPNTRYPQVTGAIDLNGQIWISSLTAKNLAVLPVALAD